jgi:hypothetical protein
MVSLVRHPEALSLCDGHLSNNQEGAQIADSALFTQFWSSVVPRVPATR